MSFVEDVFEKLSASGPRTVSLDEIGEAIGLRFAEVELVGELLDRLEKSGFVVEVPTTIPLERLLLIVLKEARTLRSEGSKPSLSLLSERTGLSEREARVGLLYGEVLARGKSR